MRLIESSSAAPPQPASFVAADGTLHIRELTVPPSELWTPEFRAYFVRSVAEAAQRSQFPIPGRTAPRSQWDGFDAWWEECFSARLLSQARARYAVKVEETRIAGVRAAIVSPHRGVSARNERRVLLNLHGGGFVYNRGISAGQTESIPVAALGQFRVITLDYRQAPFFSYPAATEDVVAVYRELLKQYAPDAIGIFGCSSGGTLTSQALAWFQSAGLSRPGAVGIFNIAPMPRCNRPPWGRGWGESGMWYAGLLPKDTMSEADEAFWQPMRWYMESAEEGDTRAYPGHSDAVLGQFPPTLFLSGTRDFAVSSVVFSHARLLKLGVDSSLYIMEGGGHGTHIAAVGTPEAEDVHRYVARWFDMHLAGQAAS